MVEGLTISETTYSLGEGYVGTLAVFIYPGPKDPREVLDSAVSKYVGHNEYYELIASSMDNPWMRVILNNINDIPQVPFDPTVHKLF